MYKYNKEQIDKNLMLFESSLNEVFAKLLAGNINPVLYERIEVTLELAEFVKDSLKKYNDSYINGVTSKIDAYKSRYEEIQKNIKLTVAS